MWQRSTTLNAQQQLKFKDMLTRRKDVSVLKLCPDLTLFFTELITIFCAELRSGVWFIGSRRKDMEELKKAAK